MKRILFSLFVLVLFLSGCTKNPEKILQEALDLLEIPAEINEDLELPTTLKIGKETVTLKWDSSKPEILADNGKLTKQLSQQKLTLKVTLTYQELSINHEFVITVSAMNAVERIQYAISLIDIPAETKTDISLPTRIERVNISWSSSNEAIISKTGKVTEVNEPTIITLTANLSYMGESDTAEFTVNVIPLTVNEKLQKVMDSIDLESGVIFENLELKTSFDYGIVGTWTSSNPDILSNDGIIDFEYEGQTVTLKIKLTLEGKSMEKTFEFTIGSSSVFRNHTYIERANDFESNNFTNVYINENNKLALLDNFEIGSYESNIIQTREFTSLVTSWSALSGTTHTVEVLIKVLVDGEWSDYLSYQPWGLGLQNKAINQESTNKLAKLTDDIVFINNNKQANAFQFKIILRRNKITDPSPEVSLVSVTLEIPNYEFKVDNDLPDFVDYDVPKLNQNIVPTIGNSICSPTSITMLLKYKGHSFTEHDEFEHRYIAYLARDYGNNIFGNWVFNTVTASSFGHDAYVKRMYSFEELMHHLHTVGPVAASVKGNMQDLYTTNGHLIVVRGYRVTDDKTYVIANDPNLKDVYFEYDLDVFMNVWRNIIYVIE